MVYNGDTRVVSDLSRFEFESPTPRNRSRNPTPPSDVHTPTMEIQSSNFSSPAQFGSPKFPLEVSKTQSQSDLPSSFFDDVPVPDPGPQRRRTLLEIAEENNALPRVRDNQIDYSDIYQYYEKGSTASFSTQGPADFKPYPRSIKGDSIAEDTVNFTSKASLGRTMTDELITLKTPITNQTSVMPGGMMAYLEPRRPEYREKELPPVTPQQYYEGFNKEVSSSSTSIHDAATLTSRQKLMEDHLIKSVMGRPLFKIPAERLLRDDEYFTEKSITITANFVLYFFELIVAIIIVTISSILVKNDDRISPHIYRFFIADSAISLIVSILFMTTIVNFEKRNGSFYVTAAMILSMISFIMTVSTVIPHGDCQTASICQLRKANSAFIIISSFLWFFDLISFLTILYISRMNLLNDLNFDYTDHGLQEQYNKSLSTGSDNYNQFNNELLDPRGNKLREYWLNEQGEMFELTEEFDVRGKNKIIVYTV